MSQHAADVTDTPSPQGPSVQGPSIDRREFFRRAEVAAGGFICCAMPLLVTSCGAARVRYLTPLLQGDRLVVPRVDVERTGAVLIEDPASDLPIYVRRNTDGAFVALSTRCGHRGCQVEPAAASMICPCHGSEYTFAGAILQGPTERPLTRYRVTSDATSVFIHLSAAESR